MKIHKSDLKLRLVFLFGFILYELSFGQSNQVWQAIQEEGNLKTQGSETNGISTSIDVMPFINGQYFIVSVNMSSLDLQFTNASKRPSLGLFKYFKATNFKTTNTFCGLIELRDIDGFKLPLLQPELDFSEAYPDTNRVTMAARFLMSRYPNYYSGPPLPEPLRGQKSQLCAFYLKDYFEIKKPGKYQLTVWPKIYERISPTNDICKRIDLPPVTVPITWN